MLHIYASKSQKNSSLPLAVEGFQPGDSLFICQTSEKLSGIIWWFRINFSGRLDATAI
jgi:hypothetical protein